ncbi:MAG: MFS transporter [Stappiaceae bacterium]
MQNRWIILLVLFFARTAMAFQFQSVAALSPLMVDSLAVSLVDIGLLIGLYLGPGIIVATLGGTVASWIGDRRTVFISLLLMVAGSVLVAQASTLNWLLAGRILSGIGGVVVNVVMTKMVIDWFAGRNIATAMAIFISSWPLGIALALLVLPGLAGFGGLWLAWTGVTIVTAVALVLFGALYRTPPGAETRAAGLKAAALPWVPLIMAALVWALYNTGLAMIFGFGPIMLAERGLSAASASSATSLFMFAIGVAAPLGGWMADRTGYRDTFIIISLVAAIILFPAMLYLSVSYAWLAFGVAGFIVGLAPGPIVSLPSLILLPQARAFGMGIYYSLYYSLMMAVPPAAGMIADYLSSVDVAFLLSAAMMIGAVVALFFYRRTAIKPTGEA